VAKLPIVGEKLHSVWSQAHDDLPSLLKGVAPQVADVAKTGLGFLAGIGGGVLLLLAAFIVAGIIMAYGEAGERGCQAIFARFFGPVRGARLAHLSVATIRAVALGVLGVALIQAIIIGLCLLVAGVPWAGVLAIVVLLLGIVQVPALVVTLPAIAWIWWTGDYATGHAVAYTVLLLVAGLSDNVLKPLLLGRGVEAPMPVILIGALGGMADSGILGMFVGATLLALGYRVFMGWVEAEAEEEAPERTEAT
jgi:predicted PurR-regulated permease PerM